MGTMGHCHVRCQSGSAHCLDSSAQMHTAHPAMLQSSHCRGQGTQRAHAATNSRQPKSWDTMVTCLELSDDAARARVRLSQAGSIQLVHENGCPESLRVCLLCRPALQQYLASPFSSAGAAYASAVHSA